MFRIQIPNSTALKVERRIDLYGLLHASGRPLCPASHRDQAQILHKSQLCPPELNPSLGKLLFSHRSIAEKYKREDGELNGTPWVAGSATAGWAGSHGEGTLSKRAHRSLVFQLPHFGSEHQAVESLGEQPMCQHPPREDRISLVPSASDTLSSSPGKGSFNLCLAELEATLEGRCFPPAFRCRATLP